MRLEVDVPCSAPRDVIWDVLVDWERQPEWMLDAKSVHVLTPERSGVGVTIRCPTNLMGATVQDIMRVTAWEESRLLEVVHLGSIITGHGAFELLDGPFDGSTIHWWEEVDPPLGALGEWGASTFVLPIIRRIFTKSLTNLAGLAEREVLRSSTAE
jgi:uncharacterized membrane protein